MDDLPARVHVAVPRLQSDRLRGGSDVAPARVIRYNIYIYIYIVLRGPPCIRGQMINCP